MSTFVRNEAVVQESGVSVGTIEELTMYDKHGDVALFVSKHFLASLLVFSTCSLEWNDLI